jgi:uncharacterized protein YwqG
MTFDEEALWHLIKDSGLDAYTNQLLNLVKPSIRLIPQHIQDESKIPVGSSKLGGNPDLPLDFTIPTFRDKQLNFVGQINLADTHRYDEEKILPTEGIFYFFYFHDIRDLDDYDNPATWRFAYYTGEVSLLQRTRMADQTYIFPVCAIKFHKEWKLPSLLFDEIQSLSIAGKKYEMMCDQFAKTHAHNAEYEDWHISTHLLGNCDLAQFSFPCAINPAADSRLLIQFGSEPEANMLWGDCGYLYWCISDSLLREHKFDEIWVAKEGS